MSFKGLKRFNRFTCSSERKVRSFAAFVYIPGASSQIAVNHKSTWVTAAEAQVEQKQTLENRREETLAT